MTRTLALDHAKDRIRVNAVAPGSVRTSMLQAAAVQTNPEDPDAVLAEWGAVHPIGFLSEPSDVAELVLFLASDAARTITGATVLVDGGLLSRLSV